MAAGLTGIERHGKQLSIAHANGTASVFTDTEGEEGGGGWAIYYYLGYLPEIAQHLVSVSYYEGGDFLLLDAQDGAVTVVPGIPVIAPDKKHFVIAGPIPMSGEDTLQVQIWSTELAHPRLEHVLDIENMASLVRYRVVREWMSADTFQISSAEADGSGAEADAVTVHLGPEGPVAMLNGLPIQQPILFEPMILADNYYTVFALDALEAGKKVYYDRDYLFTEVSEELVGATHFLFGNSMMREADFPYVRFRLFGPASLYVAIDAQAISLPGWMDEGWLPSEERIGTDDIPLKLYKKELDRGDVSLGGNWMPPAEGIRSHYLLFVAPREP